MSYSFNYTLGGNGTFLVPDTQIRPDYMMSQWVAFNADMSKLGIWVSDTSGSVPLLRCTSANGFTGRYNPSALNMTDYSFSTSILGAAKDTEKNLIGVVFRYIDSNHYYFFAWDGGGGFGWNGDMRLYKVSLGGQTQLAAKASAPWSVDSNFHNVKVDMAGSRIQVWVDNVQVFDVTDNSAPYLRGAYGPFTGFQEASYEYFTGTDYNSFSISTSGTLSIPESSMEFASATYTTATVSSLLDRQLRSAAAAANAPIDSVHWASFTLVTTDVHATAWLGTDASMPKITADPNATIGAYTDIAKVPPLAPTGLTGQPLLEEIDWSWQPVASNADGIELLDKDGNVIANLPVTATTFNQTGLEGGRTYQLSIRTYNKWGKSPITGPVSAVPAGKITLYVQPPVPTEVQGVINGNSITWSWVFPTIYSDLLGFRIFDQISGNMIAIAGPDARSYIQKNIKIATPYGIAIKVFNKMEESYPAESPQLFIPAAATPATPVPTAPANFKGDLADIETIVWKWADTTNGKGRFVLYDAAGHFVARIDPGNTKYEEAVQPNTTYQRYVTVLVDEVESAPSQVATVITPAAPVEAVINDVAVFDPNSVVCDWIPKEGQSRIAAFKSGIGDNLDLITKVDMAGAANESFNYTMQLKAYLDQVLHVYPKRQFQFRFIATGDQPVIADRGNYAAQLTMWPRRQAVIHLVATIGGQVCSQWSIPFNIWGHQGVITAANIADYPVPPGSTPTATPATPQPTIYTYTVSGDAQVQVVWNDDQSALLAAANDLGTSATWAGQVTITQPDTENCTDRVAATAALYPHWTFHFLSNDPTVRFSFKSGAMGYSDKIDEQIIIEMSQGNNYEPWTSTSDWFKGEVNGALPIAKNGDGRQPLQVPVEMLLPNGLINLQYKVEMLNSATPSDVSFYLQKGTGDTTTHSDDIATFYSDMQDNVAVPQPWYGVITEGSGPYNVTESGLNLQELIPSPMKDPTALVYNNNVATLKPLYNFSLLVVCTNPNVAITYDPPVEWAPDQLNVAIKLHAEIVNPTQTPWHPLIHNGYYYLNQAEHYLYAASDVKGEVKTLNGFAPVSFTYSVGIDAVKDYAPADYNWSDTNKADFERGQLQAIDTATVPGDMTIALDSNGQYVPQGVFVSEQKIMPYAPTFWDPIVVDYVNVGNSSVEVYTRSRLADGTWEDWKSAADGTVHSSLGDIAQYKIVLNRGEVHIANVTTGVDQVSADFLQGEMTENASVAGFGVTATDPSVFDGSNSAIYTSRVFDIGAYITDMGTLSFDVITPLNSTGTGISIYTATSDSPSGPWSMWTPLGTGGRITSSMSRYLRYQARFLQGTVPGVLNYVSNFANDGVVTNITITSGQLQAAASTGVYLSNPIDTGHIASYGAITLDTVMPPVAGSVVLEMTTADNLSGLGTWHDVGLGDMPPLARYIQYRITINQGQSTPVSQNFTNTASTHTFDMGYVKAYHGLTASETNTNGSSFTYTTQTSPDGITWSAEAPVNSGVIASPINRYLKYTAYPHNGSKTNLHQLTDGGATSSLIQSKVVVSSTFNTPNASAFDKVTYDIPGGLPDGASLTIETSSDGNTWTALAGDGSIQTPAADHLIYRATMVPGFGASAPKTVIDGGIVNQVDSYTSGVLDMYGKVTAWDQLALTGTIPDGATVAIYTATADTSAGLDVPIWFASNVYVSGQTVTATIVAPVNRYIKYRIDVTYGATPQATPATPVTPVSATWTHAEVDAEVKPFQSFLFNNVILGWEDISHPAPILNSVTISADTYTPVSPIVRSLNFTLNTYQYVAATLKKVTIAANTYQPKLVTPTVRSVTMGAHLDAKEFVFSYSTSLTGQVASDMVVHQVSTMRLKDIMTDYLQTQGIDIGTLNINNYDIKHVDPSVVLSTSDYQYGTGYLMAQTTSMNPKPLINDAQVIYDVKTKTALVAPIPRQGAPIIVKDQRGFELRHVFFVDESGNQTLTNTQLFTADGVRREVALNYQGVDVNSIQIYIDPNKDGNWVLEGPIAMTSGDVTPVTTYKRNFALCNNTLSLPQIYDQGTLIKVTYSILDSFYVDYNYDPKGVYAKLYLNNCIPIVNLTSGLTTLDVSFETKDDTAYYAAEEINLNPMLNVIESGFIYLTDTIEPAVKLEIYTNPDVLMATGYDKTTVIVMAKDRFGNPVIGEKIVFDAIDPAFNTRVGKGQIYTSALGKQTAVTDEHGIARAIYLADSTPGNVILRVTDQTANLSADKVLRLLPQNVHARISIEADKTQVVRDGQDAVLFTISVVGVDQRPAVGEVVTLTASAGNLSIAQVKTSFEGIAHSYLTVPTSVGQGLITVTATSDKYGIQQSIIINAQ